MVAFPAVGDPIPLEARRPYRAPVVPRGVDLKDTTAGPLSHGLRCGDGPRGPAGRVCRQVPTRDARSDPYLI